MGVLADDTTIYVCVAVYVFNFARMSDRGASSQSLGLAAISFGSGILYSRPVYTWHLVDTMKPELK